MSQISWLLSHGPHVCVPTLRPTALPPPAQGSLPTRAGSPLVGRVSHPLDDERNFIESSHPRLPSDQPCLVATAPLAPSGKAARAPLPAGSLRFHERAASRQGFRAVPLRVPPSTTLPSALDWGSQLCPGAYCGPSVGAANLADGLRLRRRLWLDSSAARSRPDGAVQWISQSSCLFLLVVGAQVSLCCYVQPHSVQRLILTPGDP